MYFDASLLCFKVASFCGQLETADCDLLHLRVRTLHCTARWLPHPLNIEGPKYYINVRKLVIISVHLPFPYCPACALIDDQLAQDG